MYLIFVAVVFILKESQESRFVKVFRICISKIRKKLFAFRTLAINFENNN